MNSCKKATGIALTTMAATLILGGCGGDSSKAAKTDSAKPEASKVAEVKCSGINSCKGKSACATATSACAGQNSCKGKGWIKTSKEECDAKGGTVITG